MVAVVYEHGRRVCVRDRLHSSGWRRAVCLAGPVPGPATRVPRRPPSVGTVRQRL
jgi:hypothetical protein